MLHIDDMDANIFRWLLMYLKANRLPVLQGEPQDVNRAYSELRSMAEEYKIWGLVSGMDLDKTLFPERRAIV